MMEILWADDQQDIIKTFSTLLSDLELNIVQAKDGTEALKNLKAKSFDIVILDLLMPPGKWGGLWLLEQMRENGIRTPVLILSGEGTQEETIQALRLGAKDYITKDKVQAELALHVAALVQEHQRDMAAFISTSLPSLIALPYKRYLTTRSLNAQLHRLIEMYEWILRFCCITGICEAGTLLDKIQIPLALTRAPSMGTWNETRLLLAKQLPPGSAFSKICNFLDNKAMGEIVMLRNDMAHGIEPSEQAAEEHLAALSPRLHMLMERLYQHLNLELFLPLDLRYDGNDFAVEGHKLAGDSTTFPKFLIRVRKPMITNQIYLATASGSLGM